MTFSRVTIDEWRAQVDKELGGASFDKALVHTTPEGLAIQPLYTEARPEAPPPGVAPFLRGAKPAPEVFRVCMRHRGSDEGALVEDLEGGADAFWLDGSSAALLGRIDLRRSFVLLGIDGLAAIEKLATERAWAASELRFALAADPLAELARGERKAEALSDGLAALAQGVRRVAGRYAKAHGVLVSTLPYHDAGADAADELAFALSTGVAYLGALLEAGFDAVSAARQIAVQVAVGRDTFGELCKLRALRLLWHKVFAAAGAPDAPLALLHAVCSSRTVTERDPWVNMLRVTTQVFAGVLGGADLVTPTAFDEAASEGRSPGALARRVARNTSLVLREESHLGRVVDPAGGSYYLEAYTDALAREAWRRFQALEAEGGIAAALTSGELKKRLDAAWKQREGALAKRKEALTGVSEFANLDEARLPRGARGGAKSTGGLPVHRDAEDFERLRDRAEGLAAEKRLPEVALVTLGPPAEHRARQGFASAFFAAGGLRAREVEQPRDAAIVCLCGSDERYAAEAAARAAELKAAGCRRVLMAGRPGALEESLKKAGVDGFIFVGCDVVATLSDLLGGAA